MHTVFSDSYAQRRNFLTGMEARTKLAFIVAALAMNLLSANLFTPVSIAIVCLGALLIIRIPAKTLLLRLAMPLVMAAVLLLTQVFFYGQTPLFAISIWGWHLSGYEEGLARGLLMMGRVLGGVSLVLLLSLSTPADRLFQAAGWFRVPRTFIELALLTYRYIFVLVEEFITMRDAQRVRLGYKGWRRGMKSVSTLGACLVLRAYDRAERVFEGMVVRGYTGADYSGRYEFRRGDGLTAACLGLALVSLYLMGRVA